MPSLNEFHQQFKDRGVRLLTMSKEDAGTVDKFVKDKKILYPVAIDDGGKTAEIYGVSGVPDALVLDADGRIVWRGHPGDHESLVKAVEQALEDAAIVAPPQTPHKRLKDVVTRLSDGALGEAHVAAGKLVADTDADVSSQANAITQSIEALVTRHKEKAEEEAKSGGYFAAAQRLQKLADRLKGSSLQKDLTQRADEIRKTPNAAQDLAAGEMLEKAFEAAFKGDTARTYKELNALVKKFPGTRSAEQAKSILQGS